MPPLEPLKAFENAHETGLEPVGGWPKWRPSTHRRGFGAVQFPTSDLARRVGDLKPFTVFMILTGPGTLVYDDLRSFARQKDSTRSSASGDGKALFHTITAKASGCGGSHLRRPKTTEMVRGDAPIQLVISLSLSLYIGSIPSIGAFVSESDFDAFTKSTRCLPSSSREIGQSGRTAVFGGTFRLPWDAPTF